MGYVADTFVAGEVPTTSKWNELWSNDASFNDGSGIGNGAIGAGALSTSSVILANKNFTSSFSLTSASYGAVTGFSLSLTMPNPSNSRSLIFLFTATCQANGSGENLYFSVWDGTVGSGTKILEGIGTCPAAGGLFPVAGSSAPISVAAGAAKTYNVGIHGDAVNAVTIRGDVGAQLTAFIM